MVEEMTVMEVRDFNAICYRINGSGMERTNPRNRVQFYLPAAIIIFRDEDIASVEVNGKKIIDTDKMKFITCQYRSL